MSGLGDALSALSEEMRRTLAHELVLTLEGRSAARRVFSYTAAEKETAGEWNADTSEMPEEQRGGLTETGKTKEGRRAMETAALGGRSTVEREALAAVERSVPGDVPMSSMGVRTVYGADGHSVTLRRTVLPALDPRAEALPPETREQALSEDPLRHMREISDFFRQDSRRYDPGFTRY